MDKAPRLSHTDDAGTARMVDVTAKKVTSRQAEARCDVRMAPTTLALIRANGLTKGDVLGTARIAGIMAGKRTSELIPLCHGLPISFVDLDFDLDDELPGVRIVARARVEGKTGVEMEALTAASLAALTIYDMCKAVDRGIVITDLRLTRKSGGKSGDFFQE